MLSMVNRSRSSMWIDWTNLNTNGFSDALNAVIGNNLQMTFLTDATPLEILRRNRLIVLNDSPLLRDESALRLAEYVKTGGTLILMGEAGRFNQDGKECWTLKKSLGEEAGSRKNIPVRTRQGRMARQAAGLESGIDAPHWSERLHASGTPLRRRNARRPAPKRNRRQLSALFIW